jgi:hypothetical protein
MQGVVPDLTQLLLLKLEEPELLAQFQDLQFSMEAVEEVEVSELLEALVVEVKDVLTPRQ